MEKHIKNFNEFLAEHYGTEESVPTEYLLESINLEIDEQIAINEAVGALAGLPPKWMNHIADRYNSGGLGGENSIRTTVPIKATQKKKVFGYLKDGYEGTPVLALMGFTDGQPAFMIYKDKYSYSAKEGKWKLMIGEEQYDRKIRKSSYNRRRGGYNSWEQVKTTFGQKDIMEALPDGDFEMQLITIDPERMRLRKERTELGKMAGVSSKDGIQKATIYKYILGKVKPQVDELVKNVGEDIKLNLVSAIEEIFDPKVDYPKGINVDIEAAVEKLKDIAKKLKEARYTIDAIFPSSSGNVNPEQVMKMGKSDWKYDVEKVDKLKLLLKNGITV